MNQKLMGIIEALIKEGEQLAPQGGEPFSGRPNLSKQSEYSRWKASCIANIKEIGSPTGKIIKSIEEIDDDGYFYKDFTYQILGYLQSAYDIARNIDAYSDGNEKEDSLLIIQKLLDRFHLVARQIRTRHKSRATLDIGDEYDVQDLLHALLRLYFDDIRPEEWTPSFAGSSSRMDFLLKTEKIVIEVKKKRDNLDAKKLGEELIDDIAKYQTHPDCKTLICFVYDPEAKLGNPEGIRNDLEKSSSEELKVIVYIKP